MKTKRLLALVIAVMMVAGVFAGCTKDDKPTDTGSNNNSSSSTGTTDNTGTTTDKKEETKTSNTDYIVRMGLSGYDGILNPIMSSNVYDSAATNMMFEALIKLEPNAEYVPDIATWELSEDKLTYTFTLKDGIKFSDGTPMTTKDVAFTYLTIAHPDYNGPRAYAVSGMVGYEAYHSGTSTEFEGIKIIDDKKIAFTFDGVASPANIESFSYGIMPEHYYKFDNWDAFLALNAKPLGSGPMVFEDFAPKQFIKLLVNENYWDTATAAQIGGFYFMEVPDESIISAIQTDQIDFGQASASSDNLKALESLPNAYVQNYLGNGYTFMCFNVTKPTLSDKRVRQALMYSLDRKSFIEAQYGEGIAEVGMAPLSPTSWAFPDAKDLNAYDFDMEKAAQLMDEAGWKLEADGFRYKDGQKMSINWLVYTDSPWPGKLSAMAADTWGQLGVELNIELMDFVTVSAQTMDAAPEERVFDIYTMGFSLSVDPDPTGALFDDNANGKGGFNASGYKNEAAMELVAKGKAEFDTAKRAEIYKEWALIMNDEIPHVIVAYRSEIWGVNNRIKGLDLGTYRKYENAIKDIRVEE